MRERTGLVLDPYFSATKISWLLDDVTGLRARAEAGEIAFGTVDSFLVWRLSGGQVHATDVTNASRTLLLRSARRVRFSDELCELFDVPAALLPEVRPSAGRLGETRGVPGLPDGIPIAGVAGDQQAALFGQDCIEPGDAKCTYGTGAFLLMNVGSRTARVAARPAHHRRVDAGRFPASGPGAPPTRSRGARSSRARWCSGCATVSASSPPRRRSRRSRARCPIRGGVTIVPALTGLGAPHWRAEARGLITGITRGTTRAHLARAALEAIALQNVDLVRAMQADGGRAINNLRVDGGAAANDLLMQIQADLLGVADLPPRDGRIDGARRRQAGGPRRGAAARRQGRRDRANPGLHARHGPGSARRAFGPLGQRGRPGVGRNPAPAPQRGRKGLAERA